MKNKFLCIATTTALSMASVSCDKNKTVLATDVVLSQASATRMFGDTITLTATVLPTNATNKNVVWTSFSGIAEVNGGVVVFLLEGQTTILAKSADDNAGASCSVATAVGCNTDTPKFGESLGTVGFKTGTTWRVGNKEWSDVVMASNCSKASYDGGLEGNFNADCRSNPDYGSFFSWCAVIRFQDELCPGGWHVPGTQDFADLDVALGGTGKTRFTNIPHNQYLSPDVWGGAYSGFCYSDGRIAEDERADYWAQDQHSAGAGGSFSVRPGVIQIQTSDGAVKNLGFMLRCVR